MSRAIVFYQRAEWLDFIKSDPLVIFIIREGGGQFFDRPPQR